MTNKFDNKRILIWGYGREGKSTESFLNRCCKNADITVFEGKREDIDESLYDYIFKSPGIVLEGDYDKEKYTSQTQVFLEAHADKTIGITGTKGKSTTSTMLFSVLSGCTDKEVLLLGNIGQPCLDYYDSITDDTIVVFEMSCHQLKHTTVSPHVAVFLNLYEDHLDYYHTMDAYFTAKSHIALYQKDTDAFFHGDNVPEIGCKSIETVINYNECVARELYELGVEGNHNQFNAEFVVRIATELYGCDRNAVLDVLKNFKGLSHRLELVATLGLVRFFDDSISTIPEATISAATSVNDAKTLLIGGMDRGIDYSKLISFVRDNDRYNYIFMYASGKRIYESEGISSLPNTYYEEDLQAATSLAREITKSGSVILSPAAASYGYFKNFEERGDAFKAMLKR